jgi:predicted membrane-bound spermidine synthase
LESGPVDKRTDKRLRLLGVVFFFASGAAGLMYEVAWMRVLSTFLGCTTYSVTAVLTAFMGGLALGSYIAGRYADRVKSPIRVYGLLEIGVGVAALLAIVLMAASRPLFKVFYDALLGRPFLFFLVKFIVAVLVLGVPTTLMGATLPILSRFFVRTLGEVGAQVGKLYGINTLGAFAGAFLAGFLLLGSIGITFTIAIAVVLNLAIGVAAILLARGQKDARAADAKPPPAPALKAKTAIPSGRNRTAFLALVFLAFGLSGFSAMVYQVAWTRVFELFVGSSTYAFTIILLAYLAGIAAGSLIVSRFIDRFGAGVFMFIILELIIAISSLLAIPAAGETLPYVFIKVLASNKDSFTTIILLEFLVIFLVLLLPTLAMGALFPIVTRLVTEKASEVGRAVGKAYAANTVGTIIGSASAGLVLIPLIGTQNTLAVAVVVNIIAAGALVMYILDTQLVKGLIGLAIEGAAVLLLMTNLSAGAKWDRYIRQAAPYIYASRYTKYFGLDTSGHLDTLRKLTAEDVPDRRRIRKQLEAILNILDENHPLWGSFVDIQAVSISLLEASKDRDPVSRMEMQKQMDRLERIFRKTPRELILQDLQYAENTQEILFTEEGPYLLAAVRRDPYGDLSLSINGKVDASTGGDMRTQVFFGHLPSIYRRNAKTALVVGLGSGVTLGSLALHGVEKIDALEISPAVVNAAKFFSGFNHNALENPRVTLHKEDARSFVALTDNTYDIINSIPSNPWMAGVSHLFTIEFFRGCASRLNKGGVMAQWLQRYCLSERDFKMVFNTFHKVFPYVHVWAANVRDDYMMIGSFEPLDLTWSGIEALLSDEAVKKDLARVCLRTVPVTASLFVMGTAQLERFTAGSPVNTDDLNLLEFHAPKNVFLVSDSAFKRIADFREDPAGFIKDAGGLAADITRLYNAKTRAIEAIYTRIAGAENADTDLMLKGQTALNKVLEEHPDEEMSVNFINKRDFRRARQLELDGGRFIVELAQNEELIKQPGGIKMIEKRFSEMWGQLDKARDLLLLILQRDPESNRAKMELSRANIHCALLVRARAEVHLIFSDHLVQRGNVPAAREEIKNALIRLDREEEINDKIHERDGKYADAL